MAEKEDMENILLVETARSQPNAFQKVMKLVKSSKIEIFMFLFVLGSRLPDIPIENLLIHKVCLHENFNSTVCDNLLTDKAYKWQKQAVQKDVTDWKIYIDLVLATPVIIIGMMIGPWSDKFGRKLPLVIPIIGKILTNICVIINIYFMNAPLTFYVLSYFPASIFGKDTDKIIVFSYVSDISGRRERVFRFSMLFLVINLAETLSSLIGTKIYDFFGYAPVLMASAALYLAASAIVYWTLEETVKNDASIKTKLKEFFKISRIKECFLTLVKARPGRQRMYIWMFLICDLLFILFSVAEWKVLYMFTQLLFTWAADAYTTFSVVRMACGLVVLSVIAPILSKVYKMGDHCIVIIGNISGILCYLMYGLCQSARIFYLGAVIGELHNLIDVGIKTGISKLVGVHEQGNIFALILSCETLVPLFGNVMQLKLYKNTLDFYPGIIYLVNAGILGIALIIMLWMKKDTEIKVNDSTCQTDDEVGRLHIN